MKKALICSVAALAILLAASTALTREKGKAKGADRSTKRAGEKKISEEEKQWKAKLEGMTPEQRRVALAQKALDDDLAPWKQVGQIAAEEKAVKTLAAIDKIIAAKQDQFKKKMAGAQEKGQSKADKPKGESPARQKQPRKKEAEGEK
ncbi:MAG: hypothetical protein ISS70_18030 [Phycisphaerae bacterium]|nr:hypothetical protein [Phycisphaerae bacterium]